MKASDLHDLSDQLFEALSKVMDGCVAIGVGEDRYGPAFIVYVDNKWKKSHWKKTEFFKFSSYEGFPIVITKIGAVVPCES